MSSLRRSERASAEQIQRHRELIDKIVDGRKRYNDVGD